MVQNTNPTLRQRRAMVHHTKNQPPATREEMVRIIRTKEMVTAKTVTKNPVRLIPAVLLAKLGEDKTAV